jgi:hypothetical protein
MPKIKKQKFYNNLNNLVCNCPRKFLAITYWQFLRDKREESQTSCQHFQARGETPVIQDRWHFVCVPSDSQAKRLHSRIAGVPPASGCTQPPMSEV